MKRYSESAMNAKEFCKDVSDEATRIAEKVTPSPEVKDHFRTAGEELVKGLHKFIDEKIETPLRQRHSSSKA